MQIIKVLLFCTRLLCNLTNRAQNLWRWECRPICPRARWLALAGRGCVKKRWVFYIKVARYTFLKIEDFLVRIWISGELLFVLKQRVSDWYNTIIKEFRIFKKLLLTAVAMATMTSQNGGYFIFKVTRLEKSSFTPFLFHKIISFSILNYFHDFKKIL
jgi:hypothetical protein